MGISIHLLIIVDCGKSASVYTRRIEKWLMAGKIKHKEHMVEGIENSVNAFIGLLKGENFGKLIVRVGPDNIA